MVEKISNYIVNDLLYKGESVEQEQKEIVLYGVTKIIEDVPKYIGIFFICYFLGIVKESFIILLVSIFYKFFIGGVHARTNIGCFIFSTIYFVAPSLLMKYLIINKATLLTLYVITFLTSIYVILKIAPADTEEVPILKKKKRNQNKVLAGIFLILMYLIMIIFVKNIQINFLITITILLINILTIKIVYKFFKCKYSYESEEFKDLYNT